MKLVIYPSVDATRLAKIEAVDAAMIVCNTSTEQEAREVIHDADCFFGKMTPVLLDGAGELRWIQSPTASLEHYLFPALVDHPSQLTNMRGLFSDIIADQVMGYVICFARQLHTYMRQQVNRHWEPVGGESNRSTFLGGPGVTTEIDLQHQQLGGKTMGIVGLGEIGRELARRASGFGMRLVAVDPDPGQQVPEVQTLWGTDDLPLLLAASDYVVIAAPHTPDTEGLFRRPQFQQMKRQAILINIGRGALVSLDDLVTSLREQEIGGAALDVYEIEPLPEDHPLWALPNVMLTPHIAGYAPCVADRHLQVLLDNLARFRRGLELRNLVNKRRGY